MSSAPVTQRRTVERTPSAPTTRSASLDAAVGELQRPRRRAARRCPPAGSPGAGSACRTPYRASSAGPRGGCRSRGHRTDHVPVVLRHRVRGNPVAGAPVAVDQLGGDRGRGRQLVDQAEPGVLPRRVGRQRDRGTDLGQLRCLFEDVGRDTTSRSASPRDRPPIPPPITATRGSDSFMIPVSDERDRLTPDEHCGLSPRWPAVTTSESGRLTLLAGQVHLGGQPAA